MRQSNIRSGTISAIEAQSRHPSRLNIFVDGELAFVLDASILLERRIEVGQHLSEDEAYDLFLAEEIRSAAEAAVRLVAHRPRSEFELRVRLGRKGYSPESVDGALEKMRAWNYVNDKEFARQWVASRESHRPRSSRLMKRELTSKGVDSDTAERVVDEAHIDDHAVALDLARRWLPRVEKQDIVTRRRRLAGYLQRRGFAWDIVRKVLDETLAG